MHDSKAEFQAELQAVQKSIDNLSVAFAQLSGPVDEDSAERKAMLYRLRANIDQNGRSRMTAVRPESALDLIRKSRAEVGFHIDALWVLNDLILILEDREAELKSQEKEFWTIKNRPPNYYARTIAQRLARIYAKYKGKRPTFGTARDGGHPSTDFGRALEEIFTIIGVRANVRRAAEWAIGELSESDMRLAGCGLLSAMSKQPRP